jgi:hypothetical protein
MTRPPLKKGDDSESSLKILMSDRLAIFRESIEISFAFSNAFPRQAVATPDIQDAEMLFLSEIEQQAQLKICNFGYVRENLQ